MSQFTIYSSADAAGPGPLTGQAGTLLLLLRACLVDGYAGKAAAGWTEPIAAAGNIGAFKQPAGAGFHVLINDNGPNATSTTKEAWATGWETLAGVGSPVGTGSGQFPLPAQLLTTGHVVIRKSAAADATDRSWMLFADDRTFYLFIATGDTANRYYGFAFGEFFSLYNAADAYSCMIIGRITENSTSVTGGGFSSAVANPTTVSTGCFIARTYTGAGASITMGHQGDSGKASVTAGYQGTIQYPNGPDNGLYMSPIWVMEPSAGTIRGRMRGLYHICHVASSFADGQQFSGAGDYAGKTVQLLVGIDGSASPVCFLGLEISNTVETN